MARHRLPKSKGRACTICRHEHRALIEATRIAGASLDNISAKYSVSRYAIHRHMRAHVDDDLRAEYLAAVPLKELAERAAAEGLSVLQYLSLTRSILVQQLQLASSVNDRNGVSNIARTLNDTLGKIGAITGEMGAIAARNITINNTVNNVLQAPEVIDLRSAAMLALRPFLDAALALASAWHEVEERAERRQPLRTIEATMIEGRAHAVT
jgi:hypothetical protein